MNEESKGMKQISQRERQKTEKKEEQKTSQREQEILAAAMKIFSEKGFNGATTKEIAQEAGIAEGTIYRHFKSKKDILLKLAEPYIVHSLAAILNQFSGQSDEVIFKAILKNRLLIINQNIKLIKILLTEAQFHPDLRKKFMENIVMKVSGILDRYIEEKVASGAYRNVDPLIATRAFVGMVGIFVVWKEFLDGDDFINFDYEEVTDNIIDIFFNGIKNAPQK